MHVFLTFDIEVWCASWRNLDVDFPGAFERYVFGRSSEGNFALPKTLEILAKYGLHGVFFVEPLFAARFGTEYLATICDLIRTAGHEIQLHLHPEWTDEIRPALIPNCATKRRDLSLYDLEEQTALIGHGVRLLSEVGVPAISAFRAGGFACNAVTFEALARNDIKFDSSFNASMPLSIPEIPRRGAIFAPRQICGVHEYPITVFKDGLGKWRHAQVGACSAWEMEKALYNCARANVRDFVLFSHNFEMLKRGSSEADRIVLRRFDRICALLGSTREWGRGSFQVARPADDSDTDEFYPTVGILPTAVRVVEQGIRRISARV